MEQQDRNGSAKIVTVLEKLQSAVQKSGIDRATTRPTADLGLELSLHWDEAVRCLLVDPLLSGCVVYMVRVQYGPEWL